MLAPLSLLSPHLNDFTQNSQLLLGLGGIGNMIPRKSEKGILSLFFGRGSSFRVPESTSASTDPEQYIEEGTARAMGYASAPATSRPPLTDMELAEIRLPAELTAESYARNRDYEAASARLNAMMPQIQALLEESKIKIAEVEAQGVDLSIYRKRKGGRGEAKFFMKVDKDRRVELEWNEAGQPIGPGSWGILFHEAIGCLVRRTDLWEVAFTFTSNDYSSFKNTWLELLRYYVLEDDIDRHYTYVRNEMHNKFKRYHESLKNKYIKSDKYEEDWQQICGIPSNIREESFAYLLIHWGTKYAQDESTRNSANRMKGVDLYFGGSVKGSLYRSYVDMAGGDASLSTSLQVLHTKPDMSKEQLGTQREHWENIAEAERLYRETNPEYPVTQLILPINVETNIMEHEFLHSAGKGYFPFLGQAPSSQSCTSSSTSRTNFEYSQTAR